MKNARVFQFAAAGLLVALVLQLAGYSLDHTVPRVTLENQALYNWLTLFFSPMAFFLRLGNPEGPIVAGWATLFIVLTSNAFLYAVLWGTGRAFIHRLRYKIAHENISLVADRHPERVIRISLPNWRPRRA